ncbi:substrate-binding domain-containing protein, partial [Klebsiella pneumoniae]|nr:substrate-binding domain-containing protein [Klebsiella pneumoniae]
APAPRRGGPCRGEANRCGAQVSAVSAGLGLGVLPHFMARASGLQCLQPEIGADQTLWLVMHSDLAGSRRVRVLADHLIALFADHQDRLAMP